MLLDGGDNELIGVSAAVERLRGLLPLLAASDSGVLIVGEPGTGRERLARLIHSRSGRRASPMSLVACPAYSWTDDFDELFGGVGRPGELEASAEGTVYLSAIDELPAVMQGRLARFVEDAAHGQLGRVPRLIASSRHDLARLVSQGRFRGDLYYRLSVVRVRLPPLRERREDVAPLARYFLARSARELGKSFEGIAAATLEALRAHRWDGNLAELEAAIHRAAVVEPGPVLSPESLPPNIAAREPLAAAG